MGDRHHGTLFLDCGVFFFLKEIPPDLVCDIDRDCANTFIKFLLDKQKWPEVLLLLTRSVSGDPALGAGFLPACDFSDLDLCTLVPLLSAWDLRRTRLLGCLIDRGGEHAGARSGSQRSRPPWGLPRDWGASMWTCSPILFLHTTGSSGGAALWELGTSVNYVTSVIVPPPHPPCEAPRVLGGFCAPVPPTAATSPGPLPACSAPPACRVGPGEHSCLVSRLGV